MNEILDFLNSHASSRKFTDEPVTSDDETTIVTTAQRSPTSSNIQAWSVISVRDRQRKDRLAELSGNQDHVARSGLFLVFCADLFRLKRLNEQRGYPFNGNTTEMFVVATVDATLAAGRALMAAQALGLGGVMVGGIRNNPQDVSDLLKLPDLVYPVMGMSLGHIPRPPKIKPRLPREAIHFSESYETHRIDQSVIAYDQTIDQLGYLKGREVNPDAYPDFEGLYSWSEHTARRMADMSPSTLRPFILDYLRERGFLLK